MDIEQLNLDADFFDQMRLLAEAEMRLAEISQEDNAILDAYMAADSTSEYIWETQKADEIEEEKVKHSSDLYRLIFWIAHQHNVPGGLNALIRGMATVTEDKWSSSQAFAAWVALRTKHASYLDEWSEYLTAKGIKWREIPSPKLNKLAPSKTGKVPVKEILLDPRSLGFIMHFRYLPKDEHDLVLRRVSSIPGRQYFSSNRQGTRLPGEPHWYIPGDSISANAMLNYVMHSNRRIAELADTRDYSRAAYYNNRLEAISWDLKPGVADRIQKILERSKRMLAMSEAHVPSPEFELHNEYKNISGDRPRPFQVAGVEYVLEATRESRISGGLHGTGVYVGDPMGLGKTLEIGIMATIEAWHEELERKPELDRKSLRVLILAPASLKKNWSREFTIWLNRAVSNLDYQVQILRGNRAVDIWGNFVVVNPELLRKEFDTETGQWEPLPLYMTLLSRRWFAIVADEAHMYKSWTAQRTANALELFSGKKYNQRQQEFTHFRLPVPMRVMMSGSPLLNRASEWPSQLEALSLLEPLGGLHRFVAKYCARNVEPELLKELSVKLKERGYLRREKIDMVEDPASKIIPIKNVPKDVLDPVWVPYEQWPEILATAGYRFLPGVLGQLPPKIRSIVTLPLTRENRREYMRAERDFINWLFEHYREYDDADKRVAAAIRAQALVQIQKLKHLVAQFKIAPAIKWIKNFMVETETEKLVYYVYHRDVHAELRKAFPDAAYIIGGQDIDERQKNVDQFQTDPRTRLMIATMGAGGVGITLTAANHMAIMELPWNSAIVDQMEDRIWGRLNDLHGASIYYHLADYTIDSRITAMIDRKREVVTAATSGADTEDEAYVRALLEDYFEMYGREDPKSFDELLEVATSEEDDDQGNEEVDED